MEFVNDNNDMPVAEFDEWFHFSWNSLAAYLESIDLVFEAINIFIWDLLTGNVSLNTVQPLVKIIQVLASLSELFLHCLLK